MNNILSAVQGYLVTAFILFLLIIIVGILLYAMSFRKKHSITEINYDSFNRNDSMDYLKFDKIISSEEGSDYLKGAGAIVVNKRTFVAAVSVVGYNFYSADYETQLSTINAMISFMNSLEFPISLRQTVKQIDISYNIEKHEELAKSFREQITDKEHYIRDLLSEADDNIDENPAFTENCIQKAEDEERVLIRLKHQLSETNALIAYMKSISSESGDMQKVQTILYSYTYDASRFTTFLSEEEIETIAMQELENRASQITSSLFRMGCSGKRCSAMELVDLLRRHTHPLTADDISVQDLFQSELNSLFVTSESILDVVKDKIGMEEYTKQLELWEDRTEELRRSRKLMAEREEEERLNSVTKIAKEQIGKSK